jgi:hypothetical protein
MMQPSITLAKLFYMHINLESDIEARDFPVLLKSIILDSKISVGTERLLRATES